MQLTISETCRTVVSHEMPVLIASLEAQGQLRSDQNKDLNVPMYLSR